ncbi:ralA-binding protein 1-like isoform X2 [Penaeus indicus]|uniref:ralA-binding protein 1-like isoform X2 n=1 Tax=Penaeus indicus TaxID=29960 RepID=UPI00300CE384
MFCGSDIRNKVEEEEPYGDSGHERGGKKELLRSKKKDKKDKNKDKGYAALGEDSSADEMDLSDTKSPLKPKKPKSFKFLHKREKDKEEKERDRDEKREEKKREEKKKEKEEKKEEKKKEKEDKKGDKRKEKEEKKGDKKKEKEKEKEERKREKEEKKRSKKDKKKKHDEAYEEEELPVFGVPLSMAVERCQSHDGIQLPVIVRECIDYIEEHGLHCEGIYRLSGVKSKVQHLRRQYNSGDPVKLADQEPHVVASLLKQYLRELPEPVLTVDMMPHFEDVAMIPNPGERAVAMRQLIDRLPTANRLLLQYMFKHMGHIIAREKDTKMTYQNVSIVLSPTMQISHRVLNVLFLNHAFLFGSVVIKKYFPPIQSSSGERTIDQLRTVAEIEHEIMKQESLLGSLHAQIAAGKVSRRKEERLWEAQRIVTLLKRKLRAAQRREEEEKSGGKNNKLSVEHEKESTSEDSQRETEVEKDEESPKEPASDDSKHGSESEHSSGVSQKASKSENVTVVSVSVDAALANDRERKEEEESPRSKDEDREKTRGSVSEGSVREGPVSEGNSSVATASSSASQATVIPALPKPVSARTERSKIAQAQQHETRIEKAHEKPITAVSDSTPADVLDGGDRTTKEPSRVEDQRGHITVIQVGNIAMEGGVDPSAPPAEQTQGMATQRPEMRRLTVDKIPLRETRSLDDCRTKGDSELLTLLAQEAIVQAEHEELLSMNHDLMRKLQAERAEIMRLRDEIQEMQTLYGYRTYSYDSSESEGSESDGESDTEEEMLSQLTAVTKANSTIQEENVALTRRIQEEREAVVRLRVQLQQAHKSVPHHPPVPPVC